MTGDEAKPVKYWENEANRYARRLPRDLPDDLEPNVRADPSQWPLRQFDAHVLFMIIFHAGKRGKSFAALTTIAAELGVSKDIVERSVRRLVREGLVKKAGRRGRVNELEPVLAELAARLGRKPAPPPPKPEHKRRRLRMTTSEMLDSIEAMRNLDDPKHPANRDTTQTDDSATTK